MKHIIILIIGLLLFSPTAKAGWFSKPDHTPQYQRKIESLEKQLHTQNQTLSNWQITAGSLGVGCVILLVIGTALGAQTRKHYYESGRMGHPASINGHNKPRFVGEAPQEQDAASLAA